MNFKIPIAEQMRPQTLADMVGQSELLGPGKALRNIIKQHVNISLLLWGPPGTGKTSLAQKRMIIPLLPLMLQLIIKHS